MSSLNDQPPAKKGAVKYIRKFIWIFQAIYVSRSCTPYGRAFLSEFRAGARHLHLILETDDDDLDEAYAKAMSFTLPRSE